MSSDLKTEGVTSVPEPTTTAPPHTAIENLTTLPTEETTTTAPTTTGEVAPVTAEETPATETPATEATEIPAATAEEPTPAVVEPELIGEGEIGIKTSFLPFLYQKRYIHFQDEPYEDKDLHKYLEKEKNHFNSHHNYAHAVSTGKGLFFISKSASEKSKPSYLFNLAGAEVTISGADRFAVKAANGYHDIHFEAKTAALRDSWVFTLKKEIALATDNLESLKESAAYKTGLEKFVHKPVAVVPTKEEKEEETPEAKAAKEEETAAAAAAGVAATAALAEEHKHKKEEKDALAAEKKEQKRSASKNRQRFSFFGGKKEEKKEEKEAEAEAVAPISETAPVVPESSTTGERSLGDATLVAAEEPTVVEPEVAPAAVDEAVTEPVVEPTTAKGAITPEPLASPKSNRKSFLGGVFGKKKAETPKEELATAPLAEVEPAAESSSAAVEPVVETPAVTEPVGSDVIAPVVPATEGSKAAVVEDETAVPVVPAAEGSSPAPVAKGSLFDNVIGKLKSKPASHAIIPQEVEKLLHTDKPATTEEAVAPEAAVTEEPAVEAGSPAVVSPATEKKSFLSGFGSSSKKADVEGGEKGPKRSFSLFGKKKATSPAPAGASTEEPVAETETVEPTTATEEPVAGTEAPVLPQTEGSEVQNGAIGDVVPSAVTVGEPAHTAATVA